MQSGESIGSHLARLFFGLFLFGFRRLTRRLLGLFLLASGLPGGGSCFLLSGGCCWFCAARQVFEMDVNAAKTMRMELKVRKNDRYELTETPFHRGKPRRPDTT